MDDILLIGAVIFLGLHGIAHLVGFALAWRIPGLESEDLPYHTTILGGRVDLGDTGARLLGLVWIAPFLGYAAAVYGLVEDTGWWAPLALGVTVFSLFLCLLEYKYTIFGFLANAIVLAGLGLMVVV